MEKIQEINEVVNQSIKQADQAKKYTELLRTVNGLTVRKFSVWFWFGC